MIVLHYYYFGLEYVMFKSIAVESETVEQNSNSISKSHLDHSWLPLIPK